jgi:tRNA modification GTPase
MNFVSNDTIAAISTPLGESGIGIVRLSGSKSLDIVSRYFRDTNPQPLHNRASHTVYHGRIIEPEANREIDEVVITILRAPHSYTGEDIIEISAHGSPLVLQQILQLMLWSGARLAEPGEFTKRAFLSNRIDLTQAEAVIDLIQSQTELAQRAAIQQLEGFLSTQIRQISNSMMELLAELEAHIDFPEEDIPQTTLVHFNATIRQVKQNIQELLDSARFGRKLREGVKVPIIGKPNVGKSSLLNAFLQEPRAIVTPHPGTTRDTIHETINLAGIPFEFIDTAGWRNTADVIEQEGVRRTETAVKQADLILLLFDGTQHLNSEDYKIIAQVTQFEIPLIVVINKVDLPTLLTELEIKSALPESPILRISALTNEGIKNLKQTLQTSVTRGEVVASSDKIFITNIRHAELLHQTLLNILMLEKQLTTHELPEIIAAELREAISHLGEILGTNISADLLDRIFSRFCIGK